MKYDYGTSVKSHW